MSSLARSKTSVVGSNSKRDAAELSLQNTVDDRMNTRERLEVRRRPRAGVRWLARFRAASCMSPPELARQLVDHIKEGMDVYARLWPASRDPRGCPMTDRQGAGTPP